MKGCSVRIPALGAGAALALLMGGSAARAEEYDDPSGHALTALGDVRLVGAGGERSWLDGGFGKARFGGAADRDVRVRPYAVSGDVVWKPQLGWSFGATIAATAQRDQQHPVDLSEAYLSYRRDPHGAFRLSGRAGLFWPPVSLEHSGPAWSVTETITPSAINSWIGEEVKVAGIEVSPSIRLAHSRLTATVALFALNDTAGTLLAFRGWALHDEKATLFGEQPLPTLNAFMQTAQAPDTRPLIELDSRPGYYAKLVWSVPGKARLEAFHYDNRGDPKAVDAYLQWGWRTRFDDVGAQFALDPHTRLTAQAVRGSTEIGYPIDGRAWVRTRFRAAFLLATRDVARGSVSARVEAFGTRGHGSVVGAEDSEDGWAATLATRQPIGAHVTLLGEALHVESDREARARDGLAPKQAQNVVQLALRLHI